MRNPKELVQDAFGMPVDNRGVVLVERKNKFMKRTCVLVDTTEECTVWQYEHLGTYFDFRVPSWTMVKTLGNKQLFVVAEGSGAVYPWYGTVVGDDSQLGAHVRRHQLAKHTVLAVKGTKGGFNWKVIVIVAMLVAAAYVIYKSGTLDSLFGG